MCKENGIKLIQIFEDEYLNKKEVVLNKFVEEVKGLTVVELNDLVKMLEEEKEQKKKVVAVFDKRIKNLEKAINSINSYNNQYVN